VLLLSGEKMKLLLAIFIFAVFQTSAAESNTRLFDWIKPLKKMKFPKREKAALKKTHPYNDYDFFRLAKRNKFRPGKTSYDEVNAVWMAEFAMLTYLEEEKSRVHLEELGFEPHYFYAEETESACYVVHNDDYILVVFRGTNGTFTGWMNNFQAYPVSFEKGGKVHAGFYKALNLLFDNGLRAHLESLLREHKSAKLWFTGHSLGGALSVLSASLYSGRATCVYTFGGPLTGDKDFAAQYYTPTYRLVHNKDIVARIPFYFTHVGQPKHISPDGKIYDYNFLKPEEEKAVVQSAKNGGFKNPKGLNDYTMDHYPVYYVSHLWNKYVDTRWFHFIWGDLYPDQTNAIPIE
jgi:pimeloyl-ACP methyl ester carboxylesterase